MDIDKIHEYYTPELTDAQVTAMKQFDPAQHDVMNPQIRRKKEVSKPTGLKNEQGDDVMTTVYEEVNRISIPMQKSVVSTRKHFMNLKNARLYSDLEDSKMLEEVRRVRRDNKYSFKVNQLATAVMSELQAGELWWLNENLDVKMRVLSPSRGDLLQPVFDLHGDLKAIVRLTTIIDENNEEVELTEIYTDTVIRTYVGDKFNDKVNKLGKIPIVYYSQERPEWFDVQSMIERTETLLSNFADTNDYNGAPITLAKGEITGFADKGERGKVISLEQDAELSYLTWEQAPESIALEIKELKEGMHKYSHTPDLSMEALKGQGLSGVAIDRVFIDAQLTAEDKLNGDFGECMQRSVNVCTAFLRLKGIPDDNIIVECEPFRFDDLSVQIKNYIEMSGSTISQETAVMQTATLIGVDPSEEWDKVKKENDLLNIS